ncbi:MAG TPA: DNA-binding protein [Planctomycetes bacterium]|nr:DNA-binding protein [Planctomycetota bacterium]
MGATAMSPETISVQQAADVLGVSLDFLMRQIVDGTIPSRMDAAVQRIPQADLLNYKHEIDEKRHAALGELADQAQDLNRGY